MFIRHIKRSTTEWQDQVRCIIEYVSETYSRKNDISSLLKYIFEQNLSTYVYIKILSKFFRKSKYKI